MRNRFILSMIIIGVLTPAALVGQIRGQARMAGVVLDEDTGQPIEGVTVKAFFPAADASITPAPRTGKDGTWKALFIRAGMWDLEFTKMGYIPQKLSYRVVFEMGVKVEEIEIRLKKLQGVSVKTEILKELEKGESLYSEKKFDEALAIYQSILKDNPDLFVIKMNIGNCHFALENYESALENFLQVHEKQPDRGDLLIAIANSYNNWGKKEEAIEWYKKVSLSDIKDINTAYNVGAIFVAAGNPSDALKYFQKAVEIDPLFADAYYQLGICHLGLGSTAEGIEALKKSVELAPDSANSATAKAILETLTKE